MDNKKIDTLPDDTLDTAAGGTQPQRPLLIYHCKDCNHNWMTRFIEKRCPKCQSTNIEYEVDPVT